MVSDLNIKFYISVPECGLVVVISQTETTPRLKVTLLQSREYHMTLRAKTTTFHQSSRFILIIC